MNCNHTEYRCDKQILFDYERLTITSMPIIFTSSDTILFLKRVKKTVPWYVSPAFREMVIRPSRLASSRNRSTAVFRRAKPP